MGIRSGRVIPVVAWLFSGQVRIEMQILAGRTIFVMENDFPRQQNPRMGSGSGSGRALVPVAANHEESAR